MKKIYFIFSLLLVAYIGKAQNVASLDISQSNAVCNIGESTTLTAHYPNLRFTTDYTVERNQPYSPFPYTGGTLIPIPSTQDRDDFWSPYILPTFEFSFYGQTYNRLLIGSNGLITFNTSVTGTVCNWITNNDALPNTNLYPNSIYGVYQDLDFTNRGYGSINYYLLDTGEYVAPNRVFVINFYAIPSWNTPGAGRQTSQIVLHETTNVIEVNVERRQSAGTTGTWNGAGLIGIQNSDATKFLTPEGRNTGAWSTTNESWSFKPSGSELPATVTWTANGNTIGNGSEITVIPTEINTIYNANVVYTNPDESQLSLENDYTLQIGTLNIEDPIDLFACQNQQAIDLTVNNVAVAGIDIDFYDFDFYTTFAGAQNGNPSSRISNPENYVVTQPMQTIYMRITEILGAGCLSVKSFQVSIASQNTPTGNQTQTFTIGQTLNDLEVTGTNIVWYNAATDGNLLPNSTLLQDGFTYYAENAGASSCQTKQTLVDRLAVTVNSTLANTTFDKNDFAVFPNPAKDYLTISHREQLSTIEIFNTFGQLVVSRIANDKEMKLDVSDLAKGVYLIKISSGSNNTTVKFIKK